MKNAGATVLLFSIALVSCTPQVTVTPEATSTSTPIPTTAPTETPQPTATPAAETILLGGVTLTLDEYGVATEMEVNGNYTDEQKAEKLKPVDPVNWGFEEGEAQIIKDNSGIFLVLADNPELKIAQWFGNEWLWDWEVMEGLEGGNPLFDFARTWDKTKGGTPKEVQVDAAEIRVFAGEVTAKMSGAQHNSTIYLYEGEDRTEAIVARVLTNLDVLDLNAMIKKPDISARVDDGWVCFKSKPGELLVMRFKNIEVFVRGFN